MIARADVLVRGDRIAVIAAHLEAATGARVVSGDGKTLLVIDDPRNPWFRSIDRATMAAVVAALEADVDGLAHLFLGSAPSTGFAAPAASVHAFVMPTLSIRGVVGDVGVFIDTSEPGRFALEVGDVSFQP